MLNLTLAAAKSNFFDRNKVVDAVEKGRRKALSKAGAFVRTRARTSIRYRNQSSSAGQPPSGHRSMMWMKKKKDGTVKPQLSSPLREFMFFAYDESSKSVVIGPALLNSTAARHAEPQGGETVPEVLEQGGVVRVPGRKAMRISARPYMQPAYQAERTSIMAAWANSITK